MVTSWHNWAGNQVAHPLGIEHPSTEDELAAIVRRAGERGVRVKVVGNGHSFTAAAVTDGVLVQLDRYQRLLNIDIVKRQITVEAGMPLTVVNEMLAARGLAMANLGDIADQTISGAISTSTHGTGIRLTGIAGQVAGLRIVTSTGDVLTCNAAENADLFHAARVGVGVLGAVSTVTIDVVPAFGLHVVEEPMQVDNVLAELDELVENNDHFEFYWVPHTALALTKRNNRTTDPLEPQSRFRHYANKIALENYAFGALCRVGRRRPSMIPKLAKALAASGRTEFVDQSDKVFASTRLVKFYEMEYSIERAACVEALDRLRSFINREGLLLNFPVEVRFTAPDDIPLSTGTGRESAYIAVHVFKKMEYERYFRGVEAIMDDYGGRPHWGKLHFQTADTLAPKYPQWDAFIAARDRLDPEGSFTNDYARRVFGR